MRNRILLIAALALAVAWSSPAQAQSSRCFTPVSLDGVYFEVELLRSLEPLPTGRRHIAATSHVRLPLVEGTSLDDVTPSVRRAPAPIVSRLTVRGSGDVPALLKPAALPIAPVPVPRLRHTHRSVFELDGLATLGDHAEVQIGSPTGTTGCRLSLTSGR